MTKTQVISWEEFKTLITKLDEHKQYKLLMFLILVCYSGIKTQAILKMTWKDVLKDDIVTRNGSITLPIAVKEIIERVYNETPKIIETPIFMNRFGTKPITVQYINRTLKQFVETYNFSQPEINITSLRKTYGVEFYNQNNGSDECLKYLKKFYGHQNTSVTLSFLGIEKRNKGLTPLT